MSVIPTARVYASYDIHDPPEHPGSEFTRFVCISDTHSRTCDIPPGDVLLHAGDLSSWGYVKNLEKTMEWLASLPHPVKIIIAGNHDLCLDKKWIESGDWYFKLNGEMLGGDMTLKDLEAGRALVRGEAALKAGIHYLEYESFQFTTESGRTWNVYGSPAAPRYAPGAFQYMSGSDEGEMMYDQIPLSTEILLTHTPPHGICDLSRKGKSAGCPALAARLQELDLDKCRLHVFGHIHEAHGVHVDEDCQRVSVNAAMHHHSLPVIVDLMN
ncbi:hypothetical protein NM688_g3657 [Phlebia brevispora]|uniref:Uncharacterized protein n=1 Tax=Phlebia brevispora TaxID=194682 RepID=A0ACC1T574_9APHY|nr:hypothetical protein NM688_g3657 [Phlebia brevispora]